LSSNRHGADIGFWLWFLVGVALQLFFLMPLLALFSGLVQPFLSYSLGSSLSQLIQKFTSFATYELLVPFLIGYLVIPIPYCIFASCRQKPKEIVSPIGILLWAGIIAGFIVEMMLPSSRTAAYWNGFGWLIGLLIFVVGWALALLFSAVIGFGQVLIVRWVVGLNDNPVHHVTYRVNVNIAKVRKTLLDDKYLDPWGFKVLDHEPELVFKRRIYWWPRRDSLIIIHAVEDDWTLIHGTAYLEELYQIREHELTTDSLDRIINDIVGELNVTKGKPFIDEHLKAVAAGFVSQHTRTKFSVIQDRFHGWSISLGHMEHHYRTALAFIFAVWFLIDALVILVRLYGIQFDATLALFESLIGFSPIVIVDLLLAARTSEKSRTV
jgi:hypothetical protein